MDRDKRDRDAVGALDEAWAHLTSIAALDRLLRYAKDEASSLQQWATVDLIDTAINSLVNSRPPSETNDRS